MDELINDAYILHIKEIEDNASLVYVLLESGKILRLRAPGFQKPESKNRASIKFFSFCELEYFQSPKYPNSGKLKRGKQIKLSEPSNTSHLNQLNLISQLLLQFKEVNPKIYSIIKMIIKNIEYKVNNVTLFLFLLNTLIIDENYDVKIDRCALCGYADKVTGFSLKDGGLICRVCDKGGENDLPVETLKKLITLWKLIDIEKLQLIHLTPNENTLIIDIYYNFCSDTLGWNITLLKRI